LSLGFGAIISLFLKNASKIVGGHFSILKIFNILAKNNEDLFSRQHKKA
jgi:hypothetical protein